MGVGCVNVNSGAYTVFTEKETEIVKAVLSSASIPFFFPHQVWADRNVVCMDGGTVWNTNLVTAVERCREIVDHDSQITLDILECSPHSLDSMGKPDEKSIGNFMRYKDIKSWARGSDDVNEFMQAYPDINYRHYIEPKESLVSGLDEVRFDNATITWPMQLKGREDGAKAAK